MKRTLAFLKRHRWHDVYLTLAGLTLIMVTGILKAVDILTDPMLALGYGIGFLLYGLGLGVAEGLRRKRSEIFELRSEIAMLEFDAAVRARTPNKEWPTYDR